MSIRARDVSPNDWCNSVIVPVYKKGKCSSCENQRWIICVKNPRCLLELSSVDYVIPAKGIFVTRKQASASIEAVYQIFTAKNLKRKTSRRRVNQRGRLTAQPPFIGGCDTEVHSISRPFYRCPEVDFAPAANYNANSQRLVLFLKVALFQTFFSNDDWNRHILTLE